LTRVCMVLAESGSLGTILINSPGRTGLQPGCGEIMRNERRISGPAVGSIPTEDINYLIQQTGLATNASRGLRAVWQRLIRYQ